MGSGASASSWLFYDRDDEDPNEVPILRWQRNAATEGTNLTINNIKGPAPSHQHDPANHTSSRKPVEAVAHCGGGTDPQRRQHRALARSSHEPDGSSANRYRN